MEGKGVEEELIRRACVLYVERIRQANMDKEYERGYRQCPDEGAVALTSVNLASSFLAQEEWVH